MKTDTPKLSVIICTYNRYRYLNAAFESLKNQDADKKDFEIILINNNSTDKTEEVTKEFIKNNPDLNFKYFFEPNQGLSYARNRGIKEASAPVISFMDDDAIAEKDYVKNIIKYFYDPSYQKYDAAGGKVIPIYEKGKEPAWMSKYLQRLVSAVDEGNKVKEFTNKYPVGCNMIFRKKVFETIGLFNTDLTLRSDDKYIFNQIKKHGKKVLYLPDVVVHHNIEDFRIQKEFIKKLSRLNGHTERVRLKGQPLQTTLKLLDLIGKAIVAYPLSIPFILKGQYAKAKYLVMVMRLTLLGFIKYEDKN